MKKIFRRAAAIIIAAAVLSTSAYGDTKSDIVAKAYALDFMYEDLMAKPEKEITRREFCEVIMEFYRTVTGREGISLNINRFMDTRSIDVVAAFEMGFIEAESGNKFEPDGYITRGEAAAAFYKLFKACGIDIRDFNGEAKYFNDISSFDSDTRKAINSLRFNEIMVGNDYKFHPESDILVYEVAAALVRCYEIFTSVSFDINGKSVYFDQAVETLTADFGQPERIDVNEHGYQRYIYNSKDSKNFFMAGIKDGKVKEIFSNSSGFKYGDIASGMDYSALDFDGYTDVSSVSAVQKNDFYNIKLIFDGYGDSVTVDSIYIYEPNDVTYNGMYNSFLADSTEKELWEIINIKRLKSGIMPYEKDENLYKALKKQCGIRLGNIAEKGGLSGDSIGAFEYIDKENIYYTSALENTFYIRGGTVTTYEKIMGGTGSRAIIVSKSLEKGAAACAGGNGRLYIVVDIYK